MPQSWMIDEEHDGRGMVEHHASPRFRARWITGNDPEALSAIDGPCWNDEGSGDGEDAIHIFGFRWSGPAPDQAGFEALMGEAARRIDAWIARRM